jgi:hypothetical protein
MATIAVVRPPSRHGLLHSADIVAGVLRAAGHEVHRHEIADGATTGVRYDIVILLERIATSWLHIAPLTVLIPNPEWFRDEFIDPLEDIDVVFAKTLDAHTAFESRGCTVVHTGFTSRDQLLPGVERSLHRWLHVAGANQQKGTDTVVQVWANNRDFPQLTIVQTPPQTLSIPPPPNVTLFHAYLPDAIVQFLQNRSGVHVCPSEAEGWGHYIVEGLSVGAVVLTTDAPPMNEVVQSDRGVLCAYATSAPQRFGCSFKVSPEALEAAVRSTLNRNADELAQLGRNARAFFEANHAAFVTRFTSAIDELTSSAQQHTGSGPGVRAAIHRHNP